MMMKLGEIITQIRGVSYKPSDVRAAGDPDAVALLRANNIQEDGLNFDDLVWVDKQKVGAEQYLRLGDILICSSSGSKGLVGKAAIVTSDLSCAFGAFCKVVRTKAEYASYLGQFFRSPRYRKEISASAAGANINNIRNEHIDEMFISMPSANERAGCVAKLGQIDYLIQKINNQSHQLDQLVKSRFVEMFGEPTINSKNWKRVRFDSLCENLDGKRRPITSTDREAGPYPYYGASGIVDHVAGFIFDEDILLVSEDGANLLARSTPIAFSVSGKVWVNNHAHVLRFNNFALQKYVEYYFSMISIEDYITGSTQPKLNQAKLNCMMIPLPSDSLQEVFMRFVAEIDKSKLAVKQSLEKLETLKKSLMQQYFG